MRILALETTERIGSIAAWDDDKLLLGKDLGSHRRSAQTLAPALAELLHHVGWSPGDVQLVAVTQGPGSFTGLRVGVATAKTFAYAVGAEVLGVDTLKTIALAAPPEVAQWSVAVDAQRGDVVAQTFQRDSDGWPVAAEPPRLIPVDEWFASLDPGTAISGSVLKKLKRPIAAHIEVLPESCWRPTAGNVARLAARDYVASRRQDLWSFSPQYSRRAAAEEKWEKKQGS